ncbi:Oidioi.mRNA.OKI2018_I69.PAR.g12458.t1.cds [Oikopleura dioica]|uniref:Oidioi.mRNA.OKI2018_I69.PAR.g12458.t1.cds n=1 Tax=Oikopleura dioica TaxID=34765 RepID=A0ABN7S4S0_OIKDI|nr:Oidioi.mRNA.OKI2018_I69.PAR.g12458.t1.cds [Oikopleura dioica]
MMPPQPLTMQKQQIVYRPQKAAAPISSCSISIAQQVPIPSMPLTSMPTVSIPQQSSTTPVRTKESSPEDEEINVTEVEEKIDIKEEQKDEEEIEEISNPRTTHAPQTDILFKVRFWT